MGPSHNVELSLCDSVSSGTMLLFTSLSYNLVAESAAYVGLVLTASLLSETLQRSSGVAPTS